MNKRKEAQNGAYINPLMYPRSDFCTIHSAFYFPHFTGTPSWLVRVGYMYELVVGTG